MPTKCIPPGVSTLFEPIPRVAVVNTFTKAPSPTMEKCQELVGGSVEVYHLREGGQLIVCEDGRRLGFPINPIATNLLGTTIYGDAVVLKGDAQWV